MTFLSKRAVFQILHCFRADLPYKNFKFGYESLYKKSIQVVAKQQVCQIRSQCKIRAWKSQERLDRKNSSEKYGRSILTSLAKIKKEIKLPKSELHEKIRSQAELLNKLCGLDVVDVNRMASKRPRLVEVNKRQIQDRVEILQHVGLKESNIAMMLKKAPGILTSKIENNLEDKLTVLYNLEVHPPFSVKDVLKILTKCPALVSTCTPAAIEEKFSFLEKDVGFYRNQLHKLIMRQPSILTFSKDNVMNKFHYCYNEMRVSMPDIAQCPRLWQCSLKRLKDRHKYLAHRSTDELRIDAFQLEKIVTLSDASFAETFALTSLSEFQDFVKDLNHS